MKVQKTNKYIHMGALWEKFVPLLHIRTVRSVARWGLGVIGSDVVELGVAYFSSILTLYSVFKEHNVVPALYLNLWF